MGIFRRIRDRLGQHTAEYAVVVGLVIAAIIGMQTYVRRALQARYKAGADMMVGITTAAPLNGVTMGNGGQYEPYYASSNQTVSNEASKRSESFDASGVFTETSKSRQTVDNGSTQTEGGLGSLGNDKGWK